jgi:hypothetical protein
VTDAELDRLAITGLYDPAADDAAEQRPLLQGMIDRGLTVDESVDKGPKRRGFCPLAHAPTPEGRIPLTL